MKRKSCLQNKRVQMEIKYLAKWVPLCSFSVMLVCAEGGFDMDSNCFEKSLNAYFIILFPKKVGEPGIQSGL